jgi:hypothetical protein
MRRRHDIHDALAVPLTLLTHVPCIAIDGNPVEAVHVKAAPLAARWQPVRVAAAVLEGLDDSGAVLVLPDRSRTEDADIVLVQRACAPPIQDGLANELVGHDHFLYRFKATRGLSCAQ